ncbi:MAG: hypothetical protein JWO67_146 [Streptosporangiaceae bacterium]|nr:hypothetical protein [Streptosporangiaceae bacterium]
MKRQSIEPTYDSRETGPRFHVTTRIGDETIVFQQPIPDPFVRTTVHVGNRWDLLRGLLRGRLTVEVIVSGDYEVVNDVLELDANTLTPNSTRRDEFNGHLADAIKESSRG